MTEHCRWNADAHDYLTPDGDPCKRDDYGDPTYHCTAKQRCSQHIGKDDQTCGRCVADTRVNLRWIPDLTRLVMVEALGSGVNSEAANLAGPAADYDVFTTRRALDRRWLYQHIPGRNLERALTALLPDDDEFHPYSVLTRWHMMLAEDYGHQLPAWMSVAGSAAYLDRNLHRLAQDEGQEFARFRSEIRKVREHLETVLHNNTTPERGEPCPACVEAGVFVRLQREYGHWCDDPDCDRINYQTSEGDRWVCPHNRVHWWSHKDYANWIEERTACRA